LTFNFARKGGYRSLSEEDYRWAHVRKWPIVGSWIGWSIFNFTFISLYQHVLLWSITLPAYYAYKVRLTSEWTDIDTAATALFSLFLLIETIADQQQWNFYSRREAYRKQVAKAAKAGQPIPKGKSPSNVAEPDVINGFYTRGLFRFSRHPNFLSEQCIWWSFYLFSLGSLHENVQVIKVALITALPESVPTKISLVLSTLTEWIQPAILNESFLGALLLTLLFLGSVQLTEAISKSKYPAYKQYCKTTSRMLLWFPGPAMKAAQEEK
jgi:steroid 5-alpha reductase family enzyme